MQSLRVEAMRTIVKLLEDLTQLSHAFGGPDHVLGGGGNTSVKNADTLWVKPSGTLLAAMTPETFVAMDRARLAKLFSELPPGEPSMQQTLVKRVMADAVRPGSIGRPSVEAPLHESFQAAFVVHTHPALVNGMTCSMDGRHTCHRLFPDALWVDYIDPGYALCMHVRHEMAEYADARGAQPNVVFFQNHGVFVASGSPREIALHYDAVMARLRREYRALGVETALRTGPEPSAPNVQRIREQVGDVLGEAGAFVAVSGPFDAAAEPVSPDHIVYAKSCPLMGEPTEASLRAYQDRHGCPPRVLCCVEGVFGLGSRQKEADLALELARDAARVKQLARAFGGIRYLSARAAEFIENWEAEAYRRGLIE